MSTDERTGIVDRAAPWAKIGTTDAGRFREIFTRIEPGREYWFGFNLEIGTAERTGPAAPAFLGKAVAGISPGYARHRDIPCAMSLA